LVAGTKESRIVSIQEQLRLVAESKSGEANWYAESKDDHEHYNADEMMQFCTQATRDAASMRAAADRIDALEAAATRAHSILMSIADDRSTTAHIDARGILHRRSRDAPL
jgi:hypothetical protein